MHDGSMSAGQWAKRMLLYKDGRFAADKTFCFYALNYVVRRTNRQQGNYYVDKFDTNCPTNLEELKQMVANGDTKFVEKVSYFSAKVIGSDGHWRGKRAEANSWINQMIAWKKGPPNSL